MLHTLFHSPGQIDLPLLKRNLREGDALLLLQDGVYAAIEGSAAFAELQTCPASFYVLEDDVQARGISGQISTSIARVSYNDFVILAVKHKNQMAW
ncbi:sulfurtransferase complex subunit TusB [Mangrovibacter plantisponsor]|uniref:Protein TusB n=1 Tax=Mangrovibacter plantisponsor TaxID=451513 RepID=A0A317PNZ2_9ENTR|nr:sulfurtransferase complex subunit TusB [Mangrovibacter plantisponsor]PWW02303.1 tRNA 2-thiouridine synthesizing protein B [Mangrovibacter plantisponsor]